MVRIKAIIPKKLIPDPINQRKAIENALNNAALGAQADFDTVVMTWNDPPDFKISSPNLETRRISTKDKRFVWVDKGTKAHVILPRNARVLVFMRGGKAKTKGGFIGSRTGVKGKELTFARRVNHPGTKARYFTRAILKKWQKKLPQLVALAIAASVKS